MAEQKKMAKPGDPAFNWWFTQKKRKDRQEA